MKKVLMIEDKPTISDLVVQFLKGKYDVEVRANGLEGMGWLEEGNIPDMILTDLQMPVMDGFEVIKHVKDSGFFADIPIIVLSSKDSSKDRIECLKLGAEDYLMKPFNPEELLIRMDKLLKR